MHQGIFTLAFGLLLGIRHAFEADHVVAVSTIAVEQKNPFKASLVGIFWGIGHTSTLFIIGIGILFFKLSIPDWLSLLFELFVGLMLVVLGVRAIYRSKLLLHRHFHGHDRLVHEHLHYHIGNKKVFHKHNTSFLVGSIHGLAGSGAFMILVLSTATSIIQGIYYILIFGLGSIIGMAAMSFFIGLPLIYSSAKFPNAEKYIRIIAGFFSILFGFILIYKILFS